MELAARLGQEVIRGRSYGSDLSPIWLNMLEDNRGRVKTQQIECIYIIGLKSYYDRGQVISPAVCGRER